MDIYEVVESRVGDEPDTNESFDCFKEQTET